MLMISLVVSLCPSVRNLFNVTTNDELILVCRHTSILHAERPGSPTPRQRCLT
jgi:hypothetical protein